jgi:hypothetical protein
MPMRSWDVANAWSLPEPATHTWNPPLIAESLTGFAIDPGQKRHDALRKICDAGFD